MFIPRFLPPAGAAVLVLCIASAGCAERRNGNGALRSDPGIPRRATDARPSVQPVDQSGAIAMDGSQPPPAPRREVVEPTGEDPAANPGRISDTVEDAVRPVQEE